MQLSVSNKNIFSGPRGNISRLKKIIWVTGVLRRTVAWQLTLRQPVLTLKMASAQVVETSVDNNSPSQDSIHPDDLFQSNKAEVCWANA